MLKDMVSNEEVKAFLKNEIRSKKDRGAYIFYGEDKGLVEDFALSFAKLLTCKSDEEDFCNTCDNCLRINSKTHGDLEIIQKDEKETKIGIEKIRDLSYRAGTTTYEGGNRIFIIKDSETLSIQGANALLKTIEEPEKGNYFILLSKNLELLPTIKSRCMMVKIKNRTAEELGVNEEEYRFFLGKGNDILEYKKYDFNVTEGYSYENIYKLLERYVALKEKKDEITEEETKEIIESKINIYKGLHDLYQNIEYIDVAERIAIGENLAYALKTNRDMILEILDYICYFIKDFKKLEKCIILKNKIRSNVKIKTLLSAFILEL